MMRNKRTMRLTESRLRGVIQEVVNSVLNESDNRMSREEQIEREARMHESACIWSDRPCSNYESFKQGAEWADENPYTQEEPLNDEGG